MDTPDALAPLRERVSRLRSERELAREQLAKAQRELEQARAEQIAEARTAASQRSVRMLLSVVIGANVLLLGGVGAYLWSKRVSEATWAGRVTAAGGWAPASVGEACRAHLSSEMGPFNASLVVDCGGQRLYGYDSFGAMKCETAAARAVSCVDARAIGEDGDPSVRLDLRTGKLRLADGKRWHVDITLDRPR